ncbi:hypothetical protein FZC78_07555 [Rossellomorea vietnamensis]|uniref:Uncharacterized protein n=1 Tax=Rossellomorea vietnamensis TaxID=218284 RepID=A0A5D4NW99_9BACI|nr:hypothetical protein [Rossellomorea vietnamensis]TYS17708.1 hypothetical protein FZC78_07555 [Rossellomorea vietnamensis]
MEERIERIENLLSQLISMVGNMKVENEQRHNELLTKLENVELDQEYIWKKQYGTKGRLTRIVKQRN